MLPEDQKRILGYFIEEAKDHLNTIEQGLLNLQATIEDSEMANEVFRAAHSVKGGAAMLGLESIQHTSHRLEDYFKILKEAPIKADRTLESMLLQVFDGLQEQLEQLQGPFGLTDEKAKEIMSAVEPVFDQVNQHLESLVRAAGAAPVAKQPVERAAVSAVVSPQPVAVSQSETSALQLVFKSDVPAHLRTMLGLFKQADSAETRQALQDICQQLHRIGEQFDLTNWCAMIETARRVVGNEQQTFRTLAPLLIKDIKAGQDLVIAGQASRIVVSTAMQELLPPQPVVDFLGEESLDALLEEALTETAEADLTDLFATAEAEQAPADLELSDTNGWFEDVNQTGMASSIESGLSDVFETLDTNGIEPVAESEQPAPVVGTGPEVGTAELNSLADLFEGEISELDDVWEEEEVAEVSLEDAADDPLEDSTDEEFADLFLADDAEAPLTSSEVDDFSSLFGSNAFLEEAAVEALADMPPLIGLEPEPTPVAESFNAEDDFAALFGSSPDEEVIALSDFSDQVDANDQVNAPALDTFNLAQNPWSEDVPETPDAALDLGDFTLPEEVDNSGLEETGSFDFDELDFRIPETSNLQDESLRTSDGFDAEEAADEGLDFELDLAFADSDFDLENQVSSAPFERAENPVLSSPESASNADDFDSLDFDFDANLDEPVQAQAGGQEVVLEPSSASDLTESNWIEDLSNPFDFDFEGLANHSGAVSSHPLRASSISDDLFDTPSVSDQSDALGNDQDDDLWATDEDSRAGRVTDSISDLDLVDDFFDVSSSASIAVTDPIYNDFLVEPTRVELAEEALADFLGEEGGTADVLVAADALAEAPLDQDNSFDFAAPDTLAEFDEHEAPGDAEVFVDFLSEENNTADLLAAADVLVEEPLDQDDLFDFAAPDTLAEFDEHEDALGEDTGFSDFELDFDSFELAADPEPAVEVEETSAVAASASPETDREFDEIDSLLDEMPAPDVLAASAPSETDQDLSELDSLLNDDAFAPDAAFHGTSAADPEFDELEALLQEETVPAETGFSGGFAQTAAEVDDFSDLEALLETETVDESEPPFSPAEPLGVIEPALGSSDDEFEDLEKLLEEADQLGGSAPAIGLRRTQAAARRSPRRTNALADQNMRVSVKHLDNLSNLVGELVVNRNSLEQDQERLRQFLDNLLFQVQQLNDVGQRLRDLYERSLLESSLISSRQAFQTAGTGHGGGGGSHATGVTFDALEMDRFTGFHTLSQEMIELIVRVRESSSDIAFTIESTDQITRQFRQVTTQLQESLNKARMVPFAQTVDRLPRAVRDISMKCGKEAKLIMEGRDTLIDKMILERLFDPMTHLVNNAITHGVETPEERAAGGKSREGTITVRAFYQGNQTVIYIADDGAGINAEVVKQKALKKGLITSAEARTMSRLDVYELLFLPGFSTRDQADDFAGRGVGMDVVRTALSEIRGSVTIDSEMGRGTSFTIRLPLTLSISKALSCVNNQARIAFPMDGVEDMFDAPRERVQVNDQGQTCILWRDTLLPFRPLSELLQFNRTLGRGRVYGGHQDEDIISIVVLRSANTFIALQVDQVIGEQEIVIKQLEGPVPKPTGIAGATVLGDGRVMPIADVLELIDLSMGRVRRDPAASLWSQPSAEVPAVEASPAQVEPTVLIVDDSITVRELLSMSFNKIGYRVEQARDGQEAWEKMRSGLPCDLVFCDIEMPRMDGLELLSRMQKDSTLSQIPIAMLTSRGADRHRQMAVDLGARGYFTKPYLEEMLLDAAQRMLNGENLVDPGKG